VLGAFIDLVNNKVIIAAVLAIVTFVACACQLVTITVYGGIGIRDYTSFEPDYSFILACIALAIDLVAAFLFGADAMFLHRMFS
jgi:hypothetical protein